MRHSWLNLLKSFRGKAPRRPAAPVLSVEHLEGRLVPAATRYPDFSLPDLHPSTPTRGQNLGPVTYRGSVSGYYFTNPG